MQEILLLEDDETLNRGITLTLQKAGYRVTSAFTLAQARNCFENGTFALVISDITLPDGTGLDFGAQVRRAGSTYLIYLTALDSEADIVNGYDTGADDYITKPFLPEELVLRVGAILKRSYFRQGNREEGQLCLSGRKISFENATVEYQGQTTTLTAKELLLLKKLAANRGNIVTFDALCQAVWNDNYYGYENSLMVHIRHLREKIENDPSHPEWILTARGIGYRLAKESVS